MIYVTGDTHGDFSRIAHFCARMNTKPDDIMIILGDAGINFYGGWRDHHKKEFISKLPITLFCIHGNHERRPATIPSYTRTELEALKATADAAGYTDVSESLAADIATLDAIDAEVEKLLKKRKNGYFTEADQKRLNELIQMRGEIEIKYHLTAADPDGFETIRKKLEAEVARAHARGQADADVTVYENAMVASAEGMAAINAQLDEQYDKEYQVIMLMEDAVARQAALDDLNTRYLADRRAAALEYAQTLQGIVMPVWNQEDIQKANRDLDLLVATMIQYANATPEERPAILETLNQLTAGMDEGAMTEYIALITQIQSLMDMGLTEDEIKLMFPEIDVTEVMKQIASVQEYLNTYPDQLPGLKIMFGEALPEEVLTIATDLDMTGAQARWDAFAANPGSITTEAVIQSYSEAETAVKQQPMIDAFIGKYTEIPEGADKSSLTPTGLIAYVTTYAEATTGADVSGLTPENIVAIVSAYEELAMGTKYTSKTLKITDTTLYRWRREAELQPLITPSVAVEGEENPPGPMEEEIEEASSNDSKSTDCATIRSSALDEALETIAFLTQENARLMQIIKSLRNVIRGMAEVV